MYKQIIRDHENLDTPIVMLDTPFSVDSDNFQKYENNDYSNLRVDEMDVGNSVVDIAKFKTKTGLSDSLKNLSVEY